MTHMICKDCGHIFINELVDVCQYGHGDNATEYVACPDCGHMQRVMPVEAMTAKGEMSQV